MKIKRVILILLILIWGSWGEILILQNGFMDYEGFIDASNSSVMKTWNNGTGKELYSFNCSN